MNFNGKLVGSLLIIAMLFLILVPTSLSEENNYPWWNEKWSYRQEIIIPIDTGKEEAAYQPIDVLFEFDNLCWAKNETVHSVRVIYQYGGRFTELESQIYDLNFTSENIIHSCGLVFLIPKEADGEERYYVYYNDGETPTKQYTNHVDLEETYFSYEPVPGLKFESWVFKILEEGNIIYSVAKKANILGSEETQHVAKMKKGSKDLLPESGELSIFNCLVYWWDKDGKRHNTSTSQKYIKSQIIADGNLMVKFGIVSESDNGLFRTTSFYKYYYSPKEDKGIYSNVKHELIKRPLPPSDSIRVCYGGVILGVLKSSIIEELNFGYIPKYLHFYGQDERIYTHELDQYPENTDWQAVIDAEDDYDLGSFPWISFDDGETGKSHAIILDSTDVIKTGDKEKNGIQLAMIQANKPKYPGFDGRSTYLYFMREYYEQNQEPDETLPENYVVEYNSLFYTTEEGGYKKVEKQASMYQSLIGFQPGNNKDIKDEEQDEEYTLTVFVHISQNIRLKMLSSNLFLKNAHIRIELLYKNVVVGYKTASRIALKDNLRIDWSNLTFYKKAIFPYLKPSKYVVKVFLVNPLIGDKEEFIGFDVINLDQDTDVHIHCRAQGKINMQYLNQNNNGVEGVETYILKDDTIIFNSASNSDGKTTVKLPTILTQTYLLKSIYKGFLIGQEEVKLGLLNTAIPMEKNIDFDVHDLKLEVKDQIGNKPDFDFYFSLTSEEMKEPVVIKPDSFEDGAYYFKDLYPAKYNLTIEYDSVKIIKEVNIPEDDFLTFTLYDFNLFLEDSWGLSPELKLDVYLKSLDFAEPFIVYAEKVSNQEYKFSYLYPGEYTLYINYRSSVLKQNITIPIKDSELELVFPVVFNLTSSVFDTHGLALQNVEVELTRNGKDESKLTNETGEVLFSIPPGEYIIKVYDKDNIIAQRKVSVINNKHIPVVTSKDPWQPYAVIIAGIITLAILGILSIKYRQRLLFFKLLAIILIFISLVLPFWSISGSTAEPHLKTSTNLFLIPNKMVTVTTNSEVIAGGIASLEEIFIDAVQIISYILVLSMIFIILNILLDRFTKFKRLPVISLFLSALAIIGFITAFYIGMSILSEATVGSVFGSGNLDVIIYGENVYESIPCSWGLGIGFYLILISAIIIFIVTVKSTSRKYLKKIKNCFFKQK